MFEQNLYAAKGGSKKWSWPNKKVKIKMPNGNSASTKGTAGKNQPGKRGSGYFIKNG